MMNVSDREQSSRSNDLIPIDDVGSEDELKARELLSLYADYLKDKAKPMMSSLIKNLMDLRGEIDNDSYLLSIQKILVKHPEHELNVCIDVGEYENPKKQRAPLIDKKAAGFVLIVADHETKTFLEEHRRNPPQPNPDIIAADQIEIIKE